MAEDELPPRPDGPLRSGWTTGACAAAAARAAGEALVTGHMPATVEIRLPKGQVPRFAVVNPGSGPDWAEAGIVKDAGDDPDVTHGAEIRTRVEAGPAGTGVTFTAGDGVGTVTRPGLPLAVGEPAINPVPRALIAASLAEVNVQFGGPADWHVRVSVPGGAALAAKTLNSRLGILGGISILGTTGIVTPYSCAAWIHSIHRGIDVARAAGLTHVAAATGSTSEAFVQKLYGLPEHALIDMGDFAGGTLKYLRAKPVARVTLAGGFAKLAKLAAGAMDLHSARSRVDGSHLARTLSELGANDALLYEAKEGAPAGAILRQARDAGLPVGEAIARQALDVARSIVGPAVALDVVVVDRAGELVGRAGP
ncbi:MAG: cobalt-precorrin-5B (C(1))-methyltransferase [Alphaproteobacteria bacterium]|nr:cobalt-precorrin-5B (C(1))-methyltransferase [Alphaproteobacteria bacterium]